MDIQDTLIIRGHEEIKFFIPNKWELQKVYKNTLVTLLTVKKSVHSTNAHGR